jgi:hypothetical protein
MMAGDVCHKAGMFVKNKLAGGEVGDQLAAQRLGKKIPDTISDRG